MVMYNGQMEVNASNFKANCLALIDKAHRTGEVITITKRGRIVAKLVGANDHTERPWLALRELPVTWHGDPLAPVLDEDEIEALK